MTRPLIARLAGTALATLAALAACLPAAHAADAYPAKPIRLVLPFSTGGTVDTLGRIVAQGLSKTLGVAVVPDNRAGAGGTIGAAAAAAAPKDGYTLLFGTSASIANAPNLYRHLAYDPVTSFAPITLVARAPSVLLVADSVPAHSVQELIDLAKKPDSHLTFASTGNGSTQFTFAKMFNSLAKVNLEHVPYKGGGEAALDLIAGRVSVEFDTAPSALTSLRSGRVRALAITSPEPLESFPHVPPIQETLKDFKQVGWYGVFAPAGVPPEVVDKVNGALQKFLHDPETVKQLTALGVVVPALPPAQFEALVKSDLAFYKGIAAEFGIQPQ